jgi:hypothetical protein
MSKAYVDTSVLTDVLLKRRWPSGIKAEAALKTYSVTQLPQYAVKEFKKGPLSVFVWLHNKLVTTRSLAHTIAAIQRIAPTPQRYRVSTVLEALAEVMRATGTVTPGELVEKYGEAAQSDRVNCDEYRLALKALIYRAWARHRQVTSAVVQPLSCYTLAKPFEDRGLLSLEPRRCRPAHECCLGVSMRAELSALAALRKAVDRQPAKPENTRRSRSLASLLAHKPMTERMCDDLGDAILVFFAPSDSVILTTNTRDFEPLAGAVGKSVESP